MELYHVLNRGVEKRTIFLDIRDHARFVHDLFEFNDTSPAGNAYRLFQPDAMMEVRSPSWRKNRDRIVDIHGWCLMGNHYHLLLSERKENGISLFLKKLNVGYAMYFNERYRRSGTLFQGRTKKIRINSDAYFLHILHYIHLNPLDFKKGCKHWRALRIENAASALKHLDSYRWSSHLDYSGRKNFPSVVSTDLFSGVFKNYRKSIATYLKDIDTGPLKPYLLE